VAAAAPQAIRPALRNRVFRFPPEADGDYRAKTPGTNGFTAPNPLENHQADRVLRCREATSL